MHKDAEKENESRVLNRLTKRYLLSSIASPYKTRNLLRTIGLLGLL